MTPTEITALAERLGATVSRLKYIGNRYDFGDDTELFECGVYDMDDAATALRALLAEREAIKPFIDLAVATTVDGSPDYREWVGQANDWTIVFAFAGRSITLGQLRALSALAPKGPEHG